MKSTRLLPQFAVAAAVLTLFLVDGCVERGGPDSHTEVFRTTTQEAASRRTKLITAWQDSAVSVLRTLRTNIEAQRGEEMTVLASADGFTQAFDLALLEPQLSSHEAKPRIIIREYLLKQLPTFDQNRLKAAGFEKMKSRIQPMLASKGELNDMAAAINSTAPLHSVSIIADLCWVPAEVIGDDQVIPVGPAVIDGWKVPAEQVERAALDNLRPLISPSLITTTPVGAEYRLGTLKPSANPAVVVVPEFLACVRKAWNTNDDLAMILANRRRDVRFVERSREKLLSMLWPAWTQSLARAPGGPLCGSPVQLGDKGIILLDFSPPAATRPATRETTTKPATNVYIVR